MVTRKQNVSEYMLVFALCLVKIVEGVVESFTYLGVDIHNTGSSEHDIRKRTAVACSCMASLRRNIWNSSISPPIKSSSFPSFSMQQKHGPYQTTLEESGCI